MNTKSPLTESSARLLLTVTGTFASVAYIVAIFFALQGLSYIAIPLFVVAIADSAAAVFSFRQYVRLRENRWSDEIKEINDKMEQALSEGTDANRETQIANDTQPPNT
jgi:hypothetical protein